MWSKVAKFRSTPIPMRKLMLEAFVYLAWARFLKMLPFAKVSPTLGSYMEETPYDDLSRDQKWQGVQVSRALHRVSGHVFWETECMVMGMAAMKMLARRKVPSTLYLGMRRNPAGKVAAHAWVRSGAFYVTGAEEIEQYTVVGKFAKN